MSDAEQAKCFYHDTADSKFEPVVGYWIEAEDDRQIVSYLCSHAADIMKVAGEWYRFRDAVLTKHPDAFFYLIEPKIDGVKRSLLRIADGM